MMHAAALAGFSAVLAGQSPWSRGTSGRPRADAHLRLRGARAWWPSPASGGAPLKEWRPAVDGCWIRRCTGCWNGSRARRSGLLQGRGLPDCACRRGRLPALSSTRSRKVWRWSGGRWRSPRASLDLENRDRRTTPAHAAVYCPSRSQRCASRGHARRAHRRGGRHRRLLAWLLPDSRTRPFSDRQRGDRRCAAHVVADEIRAQRFGSRLERGWISGACRRRPARGGLGALVHQRQDTRPLFELLRAFSASRWLPPPRSSPAAPWERCSRRGPGSFAGTHSCWRWCCSARWRERPGGDHHRAFPPLARRSRRYAGRPIVWRWWRRRERAPRCSPW